MTVDLTQIILALIAGAVAIMTHKQACNTTPPATAAMLADAVPQPAATHLGNAVPQVMVTAAIDALANSIPANVRREQ